MADVPFLPDHCNSINLYVFVDDGHAAIEFYQKAFDGVAADIMNAPDGSLMHGAVRIGNSNLLISQANEQWGTKSAKSLGGSPASIHLYVADVDASFKKAIDAGCKELMPPSDQFWGERMGKVEDPFGFQWGISTQTEIVPQEEMQQRAAAFMEKMAESQ